MSKKSSHYLEKELYNLVRQDSKIFDYLQISTLDGLWYWDLENQEHEWMNRTFWETLGYDPEEKQHSPTEWMNLIDPDDLALARERIDKHLADPSYPYDQIVKYRHKSGSDVYVRCRGMAIRDENGVPKRFLGSHVEVTEQIIAQKMAATGQMKTETLYEELKYVLNSAEIGIWKLDLKTKELNWDNKVLVHPQGKTDLTYEDWVDFVHPEDRDQILAQFEKFCRQKDSYHVTYRVLMPDGRIEHHRSTAVFLQGSDHKIIGTSTDITKEVELEREMQYMQAILEESGKIAKIGAWEVDLIHQRLKWSPATKEIHEVDQSFIPDVDAAINFYKEGQNRDRISKLFSRATERGERFDEVFELVTAKGNEIWVRAVCIPEVKKGKCTRVYGTFQDITEQKHIEESLIKSHHQAELATRAKSEFLANMSHEIRTPLNSVIGFAELLENTSLDNEQREYVNYIKNSSGILLSLINDVLDFSKIEAGKLELLHTEINIDQLCHEAIAVVKMAASEKGLSIGTSIDPKIPPTVLGDPTRIKQVLVNLLSNAVKFTEKGSVKLEVSIDKKTSRSLCSLRFAVKDSGKGIEKSKRETIMKAFSQEDATITRKFGGTGLGLTISSNLLLMMGSRLQVESEIGKGSTFHFDLDVEVNPDQHLSTFKDLLLRIKFKQVVIFSEGATVHESCKTLFEKNGITCTIVESPSQLLRTITTINKGIIIIDDDLSMFSGVEVLEKIRQNQSVVQKNWPAIILSSVLTSSLTSNLKGINIQAPKPINERNVSQALVSLENMLLHDDESDEDAQPETNSFEILIVDDNIVNLTLTRSVINKSFKNAVVIEASSGHDALTIMKRKGKEINLILLDIQMPEMSGYEVAEHIRNDLKNDKVKIVALTAGTVKGEEKKAYDAGMDHFLTKPISIQKITSTIESIISGQKWAKKNDTKTKESSEHFNRTGLEQRLGSRHREVINELLQTALHEVLPQSRKELTLAMDTEEGCDKVRQIAHQLRSTSLSMGFERLSAQALNLEQKSIENKNSTEDIKVVLEEIDYLLKNLAATESAISS